MNIYFAFWKALRSRPLEAIGALYWHLTGRKVRARNRLRISLAQSPDAYAVWISTIEKSDLIAGTTSTAMTGWSYRPSFSVVVYWTIDQNPDALDKLVSTMRSQSYANWEVVIVATSDSSYPDVETETGFRVVVSSGASAPEAFRTAVSASSGDYLLPLPIAAELPRTALFRYAEALQLHPVAKLLYGDNDWIDALGRRCNPWFKPNWNLELAFAQDYLSQAVIFSRSAASGMVLEEAREWPAVIYEAALSLAIAGPNEVRHVPYVQSHLRAGAEKAGTADRRAVVQDQLTRTSPGATVSAGPHDTLQVTWPLPEPRPLVSIIIPTRDKVSLLRACVDSLLKKTTYRPFEILIVDNGSQEVATARYLNEITRNSAVRIVRDDRPYNFAQLNNHAASVARGQFLCCLNNDTEIVDGGWLTAMMRQAVRPSVGAVGARLLYADRSIQHAGVVVGLGAAAGHAHRFLPSDEAGYFGRSHTAHRVSAVTAACLVVSKEKFCAIEGFDEEAFAIAFNDVDLCLRLQAAGWSNVYEPAATLLHHESKSRGRDTSREHIERYRRELQALQDRWGTRDYADPLHHPQLDRSTETYLIQIWQASQGPAFRGNAGDSAGDPKAQRPPGHRV